MKKYIKAAVLASLALIIFVIEAQIPAIAAVPGIKLGLSNIITLVSLVLLGKKEALAILMIRITLGNILCGQMASFAYSLTGGLFCYAAMILMLRLLTIRKLWAISITGAIAHNAGQLLTAFVLTNTKEVFWYAPLLCISAILTGLFTGLCAQYTIARLKLF